MFAPPLPPNGGEYQGPRANQACLSCRKQKRKCNKALPACALCERMQRNCDYSDATPPPTSEDFNALHMKVLQLESTLNSRGGAVNQPNQYPTPTGSLNTVDSLGQTIPAYTSHQDLLWQGIQNRFPSIAFLDSNSFKYGGIAVPKPSIEIPLDVLELLGDGPSVQAAISLYFETVHKWIPIVSSKRLDRNMSNPMWEAGPDLALLFLCMKLIASGTQDGIESSQNHLYVSAKRFLALLEATGTASLLVLQANILITLFEYGQAIYPAAWMSAGWCVRYGNMLGINGHAEAAMLIGRPGTWVEQEERSRTWWGVLLVDRIVSLGSQSYIMNSQEPTLDSALPVDDAAWDVGEMSAARQQTISTPFDEPMPPFSRLCQVSSVMGRIAAHHHSTTYPSEKDRFDHASQLYVEVSDLIRRVAEEAAQAKDFLSLAAPLALAFSTLCALCDRYSCPSGVHGTCAPPTSPDAAAMQVQALDGLKSVSASIVEFAEHINAATPLTQDLDRVSPIIMDALYSAASNYAWMVRESGDEQCQMALESMRNSLRRLGNRWRSAAEYLRILEAQEFTYAVGSAGS